MLNGAYYMRQVFYYYVPGQTNDLGETINIQGTITFSGSGTYTFNGSVLDSAVSSTKAELFTTIGTYVISASGEGYISAIDQEFPNDRISGLVSHGVFIGSSTDNAEGYNDLFIAAPIGTSQPPTQRSGLLHRGVHGSHLSSHQHRSSRRRCALHHDRRRARQHRDRQRNQLYRKHEHSHHPNAQRSDLLFQQRRRADQVRRQAQRYHPDWPASELLYISPDGNFIFGGSYDGWDMFVGVRAATSTPSNYTGLYYQAGFDLDESATNSGYSPFDSYYGAFQAFSGNIIGHQRLSSVIADRTTRA